tara:strand:+ start:34877 stop:35128 length:252 start_codon:yes stop_codon:yes gene_type:complete
LGDAHGVLLIAVRSYLAAFWSALSCAACTFSAWRWLLALWLLVKAEAASRLAMAEKLVMLVSSGGVGAVPDGQIICACRYRQK